MRELTQISVARLTRGFLSPQGSTQVCAELLRSTAVTANLGCQLDTSDQRGASTEELPPSDWPVGMCRGCSLDYESM